MVVAPLHKVWVVVAVGVLQDLGGHAQEPCCLPDGHATLHEPCRSGMAQGMGCHPAGRPASPTAVLKPFFTDAVELNEAFGDELTVAPASKVGEQPGRYGGWCLPHLCRALANGLTI